MATQQVPDTILFKAVVHEIWETDSYMSPITLLDMLIDGDLAEHCDYYYFYSDDGNIDEGEAFLLEWIQSKKGDAETRKKLTPVALAMSKAR